MPAAAAPTLASTTVWPGAPDRTVSVLPAPMPRPWKSICANEPALPGVVPSWITAFLVRPVIVVPASVPPRTDGVPYGFWVIVAVPGRTVAALSSSWIVTVAVPMAPSTAPCAPDSVTVNISSLSAPASLPMGMLTVRDDPSCAGHASVPDFGVKSAPAVALPAAVA